MIVEVPVEMWTSPWTVGTNLKRRTAWLHSQCRLTPQCETELYDSGASRHMSPYRHKFINFVKIQPKIINAAEV